MPQTDETKLEKTFSDLANARLRDLSPALLDYLVGFQMLKVEDDGARAVGIFGFEIGELHVAFCFTKFSDMFYPLSEDWVNTIVNRRPNELGKADGRSKEERGVRSPNYNRMRQIPSGGGSNIGLSFNKNSAAEMADKMLVNSDHDYTPLPDVIAGFGPKVAGGFIEDLHRYPKLAAQIGRFYDLSDFYVPAKVAAEKKDDVVIISGIAQEGAEKLTDEQKEKVVGGGFAVVDKRPEMEKSVVYRNEAHSCLTNPTDGGLYDVLMSDGKVEKLFCFRVASSDDYLVYDPDGGRHGMLHGRKIFTLRQYDGEEFRKELDKETVSPDGVRPNDCVVFCQQTGECTLPFEIEDSSMGANGLKALKIRGPYYIDSTCCTSGHAWAFKLDGPAPWRAGKPSERVREILITEAGSGAIRYTSDRLVVNEKRFRGLVLNRAKSGEDSFGGYTKSRSETSLLERDFGDHNTIKAEFEKVAAPLKVWRVGDDISIQDQFGTSNFGHLSALGYLIRKHGCAEEDATIVLSEARREPQRYRVKYAAELLPFPQPQDESEGGLMSNFHQTQVPATAVEKANSPSNREFYQYHSPFGGFGDSDSTGGDEQSTADTVDTAAQTGQKEVFDASVLSSLIKTHNPTGLLDRFLPTIVSGMDRLGRIMFLLNWHYTEFEEQFGKDDLTEFSDDLKSCFEQLGDLVLFMRKRTLSGDPESYGLGLNAQMEG